MKKIIFIFTLTIASFAYTYEDTEELLIQCNVPSPIDTQWSPKKKLILQSNAFFYWINGNVDKKEAWQKAITEEAQKHSSNPCSKDFYENALYEKITKQPNIKEFSETYCMLYLAAAMAATPYAMHNSLEQTFFLSFIPALIIMHGFHTIFLPDRPNLFTSPATIDLIPAQLK